MSIYDDEYQNWCVIEFTISWKRFRIMVFWIVQTNVIEQMFLLCGKIRPIRSNNKFILLLKTERFSLPNTNCWAELNPVHVCLPPKAIWRFSFPFCKILYIFYGCVSHTNVYNPFKPNNYFFFFIKRAYATYNILMWDILCRLYNFWCTFG